MAVELGYAEITAPATVTAVAAASSTQIIALPSITFDGVTSVIVEMFWPEFSHNTVAENMYVELWVDGVGFQRLWDARVQTAAQPGLGSCSRFRYTPTAGAKVLTMRAHMQTTSGGVIDAGPGGVGQTCPAYIRVTTASGEQVLVSATGAQTSVVATLESAPTTLVTLPQFTLTAQTTVMVELFFPWSSHTSNTVISNIGLRSGSTSLGRVLYGRHAPAVGFPQEGRTIKRRLVLSAGTYDLSWVAWTASGTFTVAGGAGGGSNDVPMLARVMVESGGVLAETEISESNTQVNVDCLQTIEANATVIVTAPVFTADGVTKYRLENDFNSYGSSVNTNIERLNVFDSFNGGAAASIGCLNNTRDFLTISSSRGGGVYAYEWTPAAGTHVLSVRGWVSAAGTYRLAGDVPGDPQRDTPFSLRVISLAAPGAGGLLADFVRRFLARRHRGLRALRQRLR